MNKKIITMILSLIFIRQSYSCEVTSMGSLNLAVSTIDSMVISYGATSTREQIPFFNVKNCQLTTSKNKFLMIGMGPEVVELSDKIRGTNFNRYYVDSKCEIKNNPLKIISTNADQKNAFEKKWKFINECVEVQLTEFGSRPITFPTDQEGCKVKILSPKSISFNGGYCFFKPKIDSNLKVELKIAESCKKLDGYKENGVNLQDLSGDISFYTSSNYKGDLAEFDAIASSTFRISTNPVSSLIKPGEDFGVLRPLFPEKYIVNDLHLGKIQFDIFADKFVLIYAPIIASNFCQEVKAGGIKSSYCDYATPIVAEYFLKNEKNETLLNWYDGGVAPAQWQGIINGEGYQTLKDVIAPEKNYKLEVYFSDPYFDFNFFKQRIRSKFNYNNPTIPILAKEGSLNEIPEYASIDPRDNIPAIEPIATMDSKKWTNNIKDSRQILENFFTTSMFPSMYAEVCLGPNGECQKFKKYFAKFTANFWLNADFSLSKLKIKRESDLLEPYEKELSGQPEYRCK